MLDKLLIRRMFANVAMWILFYALGCVTDGELPGHFFWIGAMMLVCIGGGFFLYCLCARAK